MKRKLKDPVTQQSIYDAAPFPARMPRLTSAKESRDWGLEGLEEKIPEGVCVMIIGTKKIEA